MRTIITGNNVSRGGAFLFRQSTRPSRMVAVEAKKRILITGGNTGIGFETALALVRKDYEVVLACRDVTKAADAEKRLRASVPGASVRSVTLDLANLKSVKECAQRLIEEGGADFDVLLNNAGVMATPKMTTEDGFEFQLGTNHLGHFLFTMLLLPSLVSANKPVRIINVASTAHMMGKVDMGDLMRERSYSAWEAYGQSKLANIYFTYELAKRLAPNFPQVQVNCLHPGVVKTELGRYLLGPDWVKPFLPLAVGLASVFLKTPEQGAQTSIYLASSPEVEGISGKYYMDCKPVPSSPSSYDPEISRQLFEASVSLTGAPPLPLPSTVPKVPTNVTA